MRTFVFLFSLIINFWDACAQTDTRCGTEAIADLRFESWLASKAPVATAQSGLVYRIPVVVHLLHDGDALGEGFNFPVQRVEDQIRTLNEDFRRKDGTPGFNSHPDGADTQIEFVLAKIDPDGNPTDGIVRINMKTVEIDITPGDLIRTCSKYSYWDPDQYLNIWTMPMGIPPGIFLGVARFPVTDLPGGFPDDVKEEDGDGVFVNAVNFGRGLVDDDPNYSQGRTLTHEIGHFLGLLHTYSTCDPGDYCDDTPPSASGTHGCPETAVMACDGRRVMTENYMDVSYDRCMNIFTRNQTSRMHKVLNASPRRKSLLTSPALPDPVTGIPDDDDTGISVYPNPVVDKLYVSMGDLNETIDISIHTTLGVTVMARRIEMRGEPVEVQVPVVREKMLVVVVRTASGKLVRRLVATAL